MELDYKDIIGGITAVAGCFGAGAIGGEIRAWMKARRDAAAADRGEKRDEMSQLFDVMRGDMTQMRAEMTDMRKRVAASEKSEQRCKVDVANLKGYVLHLEKMLKANKVAIDPWNPDDSAMHRTLRDDDSKDGA